MRHVFSVRHGLGIVLASHAIAANVAPSLSNCHVCFSGHEYLPSETRVREDGWIAIASRWMFWWVHLLWLIVNTWNYWCCAFAYTCVWYDCMSGLPQAWECSGHFYTFSLYKGIGKFLFQANCSKCIIMPVAIFSFRCPCNGHEIKRKE